ncbi:MAG: NAD(P)H-hydrate dehydratase [Gammaproteobacteria bacterium]|nr:NAD(P)H-hydrate dehydratase [Gammaproteobacteria bacterium]
MNLYHPESVYLMDRAAVENDGLPEIELMQRAGTRVWREINQRWPGLSSITVLAGAGNNGGDAFVVAILARQQCLDVQLIVKGELTRQSKTSTHYRELWQQGGGDIEDWQQQSIKSDLIVDGLLGIGLKRDLDEDWQLLINEINQSTAPKVAIDIPSGLNAQTGVPQPVAVEAEMTVTFIGRKVGHVLADGPDFCGELIFDDLGISSKTANCQIPALKVISKTSLILPEKRKRNSHKNSYGHVLIIGGDRGMSGAASLAGQAALRSGAGMVSVLVHPECVNNLSTSPELMVQSWTELEDKLAQASVVVIGPGLGQGDAAKACLIKVSKTRLPLIVDASALTSDFLTSITSQQVVITPHPGEAAKLLSVTTKHVQTDRLAASQQLCELYPFVCVLKGSGTIIQQKGQPAAINTCGNSGMASAGMGDVLAGIIGAYMGQHLSAFDAARTGVYIHARCADRFTEQNDETGLIASDIMHSIPEVVKQVRG